MLSFHIKFVQTDRRITVKQYAPHDLSIRGHKKGSPKWVENTVGNGEIARDEQFLPFPQFFQKTHTADT